MYTKTAMIRVKKPFDVPTGAHYAVLIYKTLNIFVEGDERSRRAPGHGYPAHTDTHETFQHWVTADTTTLKDFVKELESVKQRLPYVLLNVNGKMIVDIQLVVQVK